MLQGNIVFDIYSPSTSTTSKNVLCSSTYCDLQNQCSAVDSTCPYKVAYVSANTSSSGVLVQDVLHLVTDDSDNRTVAAPIIFGCGQVQTGSFLDSAAINGLFGLGLERISVPSTLSMNGLISNSFSMCFGKDGLGRLRFGDKGSSDQDETPINIHGRHPTYNVTVTGLRVGNNSIAEEFYAFVDSGTSFTYLEDPAYTNLAENVNSVISDQRIIPPSTIPFEYCYVPRLEVPTLSVGLQMSGGREFPVIEQFIRVRSEVTQVKFYCLALLRSHGLNIIGQNFMTGLKIVFDREKNALGWKAFNCYDVEDSNILPVKPPRATAPSPTHVPRPTSYNPEAEATQTQNKNNANNLLPPAMSFSHSLYSTTFRQKSMILSLLSIAVL